MFLHVGLCTPSEGQLAVHTKEHHTIVRCWVLGCTEQQESVGESAIHAHMKANHPAKGRRRSDIPDQNNAMFECGVDNCSETFRLCTSRNIYMPPQFHKHLQKERGIENKKEREPKFPKFAGNPCFFPDCDSTTLFPCTKEGKQNYQKHLRIGHKIKDEHEQHEYTFK
jgi:hypothetical protein